MGKGSAKKTPHGTKFDTKNAEIDQIATKLQNLVLFSSDHPVPPRSFFSHMSQNELQILNH